MNEGFLEVQQLLIELQKNKYILPTNVHKNAIQNIEINMEI